MTGWPASLDGALIKAVEAMEMSEPTLIQLAALDNRCDDKDVLMKSKTGSGKTLAFLLPVLHQLLQLRRISPVLKNLTNGQMREQGTMALIIVPTRELAVQTSALLTRLISKLKGQDHWLVSGTLSGGENRKSEKERLRKGVHLIVGTPGRLVDHLRSTKGWADKTKTFLRFMILDEADRLMDMGFERYLKEILQFFDGSQFKMVLCSATVSKGLKEFCGRPLNSPVLVQEQQLISREAMSLPEGAQLKQHYVICPTKSRLAVLLAHLQLLFQEDTKVEAKIVLFTICCDTVDLLHGLFACASLFPLKGVELFKLHGSLEHRQRLSTFQAFQQAKGKSLLICTDVAARGLNLSNVTQIIQYDAPCDAMDYMHRAGRTARAGESGSCLLFLMPSEREYLAVLKDKGMVLETLPEWMRQTETFLKGLKLKGVTETKAVAAAADEEEEEESNRLFSIEAKRKLLQWLDHLMVAVKKTEGLNELAKKAYLSFLRAYQTHPSTEKGIFHVKKLHLGHLAATFLLSDPPKSMASKAVFQKQQETRALDKGRPRNRNRDGSGSGNGNGNGSKKKIYKRAISEFDAGDLSATTFSKKVKSVRK